MLTRAELPAILDDLFETFTLRLASILATYDVTDDEHVEDVGLLILSQRPSRIAGNVSGLEPVVRDLHHDDPAAFVTQTITAAELEALIFEWSTSAIAFEDDRRTFARNTARKAHAAGATASRRAAYLYRRMIAASTADTTEADNAAA